MTEPQTATLALLNEGVKLSILNKYDEYIKKAVKPTYRRLKTYYAWALLDLLSINSFNKI